MFSEDQIVSCFARRCRETGGTVLAQGANQAAGFRYMPPKCSWKSPDVVCSWDGALLVCEAKCSTGALFTRYRGNLSDFEALGWLQASMEAQSALAGEARRRLSVMGKPFRSGSPFQTAVLSAGPFDRFLSQLRAADVQAYHCTCSTGVVIRESPARQSSLYPL